MKNIKQIPTEHLIIALYRLKALLIVIPLPQDRIEPMTNWKKIKKEVERRGGFSKCLEICKDSFKILGLEELL